MPHSSDLLTAATHVFPNVLLFDGGRYVVATLVMMVLLAITHRFGWRARKLQARDATRSDMVREITASVRSVFIYAAIASPAVWMRWNGYAVGSYTGVPSWGEVALYVVALLILHDTWFYWTHRAMHAPVLFRTWHRLHHRSITPTPFAAYAFDWREAILQVMFVQLFIVLIPTPNLATFIFLGLMIVRNVWGHCGTEFHPRGFAEHWLWGMFTTTTHHDLHHSGSFGCNFGLYFTWWDRICGTERPCYRETFREITSRGSVDKPCNDIAVAA